MKAFTLTRFKRIGDAMLSVLTERGGPKIYCALENSSTLIEPGSYLAMKDSTGSHKWWTLIGRNVHPDPRTPWADRSAVEMHVANVADQLDGCIAIGFRFLKFDSPTLKGSGSRTARRRCKIFKRTSLTARGR